MKEILIVDDEENILTLLEYNLNQAGYSVDKATDGEEAYQIIKEKNYDFIILDIMLPGMDGIDVCRRVRKEGISTPILMLTAKTDEYDKIIGLELGADDYMTKPFSPREVVARIKAIFRRTESQQQLHQERQANLNKSGNFVWSDLDFTLMNDQSVQVLKNDDDSKTIRIGKIEINTNHYEVLVDNQPIDITPKEFDLLVYMALRKGRVLSREQLLNSVWDFDYEGETRIVDVHISHLREKIETDSKRPEYIKTVRGFGYKFEVPEE